MKKLLITFSFALALGTMNLQSVIAYPINIGLSKTKKSDIEVKDFNAIAIGGPIEAVVQLGNTESLKLEGDADAIAALKIEVKNNVLTIKPDEDKNDGKGWNNRFGGKKIKAYISAKQITSLSLGGSGSINVNGTIKATKFLASLGGSGSIRANLQVNEIKGSIGGSGTLNFTGKGENADISMAGSGSFKGSDFSVEKLSASIAGSGDIEINVDEKISASIVGSGRVNYKGNATVSQTTMGSGRVRKI